MCTWCAIASFACARARVRACVRACVRAPHLDATDGGLAAALLLLCCFCYVPQGFLFVTAIAVAMLCHQYRCGCCCCCWFEGVPAYVQCCCCCVSMPSQRPLCVSSDSASQPANTQSSRVFPSVSPPLYQPLGGGKSTRTQRTRGPLFCFSLSHHMSPVLFPPFLFSASVTWSVRRRHDGPQKQEKPDEHELFLLGRRGGKNS